MSPSERRPPAVARVLERLVSTVRHRGLIEPGQTVLLAVSGGPDSTCLLHAMARVSRLLHVRLAVAHVDHGMRTDSAADAAYVERSARAVGLPVRVLRIEGRPSRGASVEAFLRGERYRLLEAARRDAGVDLVATAHTADDQAETVLMALLRGAGLSALGGIAPRRDRVIRPLLDVTRDETAAFCRALRLRPRSDPMNLEPGYLRVAVRQQVLPAIARATGREVRATIGRTADALREDATLLDALAARASRRIVRRLPASGNIAGRALDAGALAALPYPVASRVVARSLDALGLPAERARAHVDAVLDLAAGPPGRRADLPGALNARRVRSYVHLLPASPASPGREAERRRRSWRSGR